MLKTSALQAFRTFGTLLLIGSCSVVTWAQAEKSTLITGATSTWAFRLAIDPSISRCNVEIRLDGGIVVEQELNAPNFEGKVTWTPSNPGPVNMTWKGKTKFRGLNTTQACPGGGSLTETVQASADFVNQRWIQALGRLGAQEKECVQIGMRTNGLLMQSTDPNARLTDPADEVMKPIYQRCDAFLSRRLRDSLDCNIAGRTRTTCEEGWRTEADGRPQRLNFEDAVRALFQGKAVTVALYEKADAREARDRADKEAAAKLAADAAAKKDAEEKQRRWLESPEYKQQQAEIAAREQRTREEAARLQAQREREKAEAERLAAEQKRREEEARVKALANLKVKNVALGVGPVPCTAEEATYVDMFQKPVRLQYQCRFGPEEDQTLVVFAADRKTVVSVLRRQFLKPSDPEPGEVLKAAIRFYGPPVAQDDGNWMALYGNPYSYSYNGRRVNLSENSQGIGLLIKGKLCGDGRYGTERCGNLGTTVMEFELVNQAALNKSYEDGKARLASQNSSRINNQKF